MAILAGAPQGAPATPTNYTLCGCDSGTPTHMVCGYIEEFFFEDQAWSAAKALKYYLATTGKYGVR